MDFILKLTKRTSTSEHISSDIEETKSQGHNKKGNEKQLAVGKINITSVYNKNEEYKPLGSAGMPGQKQTLYEKNTSKFRKMIEEDPIVDLEELKKLAWQGVSQTLRPTVWKILLKYVPLNKESRESTVARKRGEYANFNEMYLKNMDPKELDEHESKMYGLIKKDVMRTQPDYPFFQHPIMQDMMIRLLWIWHVRHPASGYVQGINDLTTPFIGVFAGEYTDNLSYETFDVPRDMEQVFTEEVVAKLEADTYWCLCRILDGILDNYTSSQSGTHKSLAKIKEITKKIDFELYSHLEEEQVDFTFFSFRWIFCLLVREFPLKVGMRLFDTYISDEHGFSLLHTYVCTALLLKWSVKVKKLNFTNVMLFLQKLPTQDWSEKDIEVIIAEAYVFKSLYEDTQAHFSTK